MIESKKEKKHVTLLMEQNEVHNSAISGADLLNCVPPVAQGTDDYQRQGDVIFPTSLTVRGTLGLDRTYSTDNKVIIARVVIVKQKSASGLNYVNPTSIASNLLKPNLSTGTSVVPFSGMLQDLDYPINTDMLTVLYDKKFRLAPVQGDSSIEQNPQCVRHWTAKIRLPKKFFYDSSVPGNVPTNFAPMFGVGYTYADGTGPDIAQTRMITTTSARLYYTDA